MRPGVHPRRESQFSRVSLNSPSSRQFSELSAKKFQRYALPDAKPDLAFLSVRRAAPGFAYGEGGGSGFRLAILRASQKSLHSENSATEYSRSGRGLRAGGGAYAEFSAASRSSESFLPLAD